MAKQASKRFDEELSTLFRARTHSLRDHFWPKVGKAPSLGRQQVSKSIRKLQGIAEAGALKSRPTREMLGAYDYKRQWHPKRGKGWGRPAKRTAFKDWYDKHITTKNCVYAFWNRKKCLYIGRTLNGKGRPTSHFDKHWFGKATRVDVYGFDRKRDVPRFECLLTHKHQPAYSRMRPASKKYYSQCVICAGDRLIRTEIKSLFRLR